MTAVGEALWDNLYSEMKREVAVLAAARQSRCVTQIEAGLPASLPEVSDDNEDDTTMETGFDHTALPPVPPVHYDNTMTHAHYNVTVTKGNLRRRVHRC
ncbi:NHL repeat-containing protein 2 [Hordeum vulgare]|nr:NHL repeat-containing protein 2 [Hordeum vulgare]